MIPYEGFFFWTEAENGDTVEGKALNNTSTAFLKTDKLLQFKMC